MNHKDFADKEMQVGDIVAFVYHDLVEGEVLRFSPKMVEVEYGKVQKWSNEKPKKFVYPHNCVILSRQTDTLLSSKFEGA